MAVTDFGGKFSFPLRYPTEEEWSLPVLEPILGIRDTPPDSWTDEVTGFIGRRLETLELGPKNVAEEEPSAKKRKGCLGGIDERKEQPCYDGPSLSTDRIGRYRIFTVETPIGLVYLTDSKWRDKETAILFFSDLEDARSYCRGKRSKPPKWFGRLVHDHNGLWRDKIPASIILAAHRGNVTLEKVSSES